ncbi:MAG: GNAT family N-acetyltransferase [Roseibium sp.]
MTELVLNLDGYTDVPVTKIAFVVTHLEMTSEPQEPLAGARQDLVLERWNKPGADEYQKLFREVGENWIWFGRLKKSSEDLEKMLHEPDREHFRPMKDGKPVGILELNYANTETVELAYFGLVPGAIGGGVGRWLMSQAVDMAWSRPETKRIWLHTCTGDSPQAMMFYRSCGFKPFRRCIEVIDDPRLEGLCPKNSAPHVPYLAD